MRLTPEEYPNIIQLSVLEPAGKLVGVDRGGDLKSFRIAIVNLGPSPKQRSNVTTRESRHHTSFALLLAKIGYSYAVAELGIGAFDGSEIRDLLKDRRQDSYNFVGGMSRKEHYAERHLHALYVKRRGAMVTVVVHLFASLGMVPYEVVVGEIGDE